MSKFSSAKRNAISAAKEIQALNSAKAVWDKDKSWSISTRSLNTAFKAAAMEAIETIRGIVNKSGLDSREFQKLTKFQKEQVENTTLDMYAAEDSKNYVKAMLPRDTGNLQDNAFKVRIAEDGVYEIYIDYLIAPYAGPGPYKKKDGTMSAPGNSRVYEIIEATWPLIKMRFEERMAATMATINGSNIDREKSAFRLMYGLDEEF